MGFHFLRESHTWLRLPSVFPATWLSGSSRPVALSTPYGLCRWRFTTENPSRDDWNIQAHASYLLHWNKGVDIIWLPCANNANDRVMKRNLGSMGSRRISQFSCMGTRGSLPPYTSGSWSSSISASKVDLNFLFSTKLIWRNTKECTTMSTFITREDAKPRGKPRLMLILGFGRYLLLGLTVDEWVDHLPHGHEYVRHVNYEQPP